MNNRRHIFIRAIIVCAGTVFLSAPARAEGVVYSISDQGVIKASPLTVKVKAAQQDDLIVFTLAILPNPAEFSKGRLSDCSLVLLDSEGVVLRSCLPNKQEKTVHAFSVRRNVLAAGSRLSFVWDRDTTDHPPSPHVFEIDLAKVANTLLRKKQE